MKTALLYVHGKGGAASECERFKPLFPSFDVFGLDYKASTPKDAGKEISDAVKDLKTRYEKILLAANSIGAFFCMYSGADKLSDKAFFISPVVDMKALILGMMNAAGVTEKELREKGKIQTASGEELSWEYLRFVRENPIKWDVPTHILYGENDALVPFETVKAFAEKHNARVAVLKNGEHWFHTEEQTRFLDECIKKAFCGE
ncbi:MAG: alpha/beta hydrolase [Clostridia bacterium]|nr:alpha/beta hydrolase [Clostridia bacterium]